MIRIAICDDDIREVHNTKALLLKYGKTEDGPSLHITEFYSFSSLLSVLNTTSFRIYILDILMPGHGIRTRSILAYAQKNGAILNYQVEDSLFKLRILFPSD